MRIERGIYTTIRPPKAYFLSDPHFSHANIMKYEPIRQRFIDAEEMDNVIIENYNRTISEGDIVFWLGDMFFCNSKRMEYISKRLNKGRNIVIRGNHDKGVSDTKFKRLGFMPYKMFQWNIHLLTHEPVSINNMKLLSSMGVHRNIHGHVHSQIEDFDPTIYQCVSVENTGFEPISSLDLMERFKDGNAWARWAERKRSRDNN